MNRKSIFFFAVFFLLLTVIFVHDSIAEKKVYKATIDKDGVQRVEVIGGGYYYKPDYIIVKVNVPVELKEKKDGFIVPHDIVMDEPEAGIVFRESMSTDPKTIKFTPKKVGKFHFYCSKKVPFLKSHKDRGMEGVLEVVE